MSGHGSTCSTKGGQPARKRVRKSPACNVFVSQPGLESVAGIIKRSKGVWGGGGGCERARNRNRMRRSVIRWRLVYALCQQDHGTCPISFKIDNSFKRLHSIFEKPLGSDGLVPAASCRCDFSISEPLVSYTPPTHHFVLSSHCALFTPPTQTQRWGWGGIKASIKAQY